MRMEFNSNISRYRNSGRKTTTYSGSVSLYGKDNKYDFDLSYSVGKASYTMDISRETKTTGFWMFKRTKTRYVADVKVEDIYNFDEYRDDERFGSIMNNFGYDMQKSGIIKPYSWDANFKIYGEWS